MPNTNPESARIDPAATRRRLAASITSKPYQPDLLARIAQLSLKLDEQAQAGRYWMLSGASGTEVDAAVEAFAASCQHVARWMASELPRFAGDWEIEAYLGPARARIEKYGLAAELARRAPRQRRRTDGPATAIALVGLLALLLLGAGLVWLGRR